MSQLKSNDLSVKAEQVRQLVALSETLERESIDASIEAGKVLAVAKTECRHGEWLPFLGRAGVPERKAQRLMQIARSGLKSDTVSDLGGVKATLEFLSRRKLPKRGEALLVNIHGYEDNPFNSVLASFIWPSSKHDGHYFVAGFRNLDGHCSTLSTIRAISGADALSSDGHFVNPVWTLVARNIPIPMGNWHFHTVPHEVAEIIEQTVEVKHDRTAELAILPA